MPSSHEITTDRDATSTLDQPIANDESESLDHDLLRDAIVLLSQQCWCWGQDVARAKGNWLVQLGFERHPPPPERSECASVYLLRRPEGQSLILRGFGVFFGCQGVGGIFLPRFEFTPQFTNESILRTPPWDPEDLPSFRIPQGQDRDRCLTLLLDLLDWIWQYEAHVADQLGFDYRQQSLKNWHNGERRVIAAIHFATAWKNLASRIAQSPNELFGSSP